MWFSGYEDTREVQRQVYYGYVEAGITAGFVNFNQSLPDVHMFTFRNGKVELISAVFGGRQPDAIWPDEKK